MVFSTYEEKWYNEYYANAVREHYKQDTYAMYSIVIYKALLPTWAIDGVL